MSEHSYSADTEVSRLDGELLAAGRTIAELQKRAERIAWEGRCEVKERERRIGELEAERDRWKATAEEEAEIGNERLRDLTAERQRREWREIDSAPKDGTPVLVRFEHINFAYAKSDTERDRWYEVCVAKWIDHNGGGWTWHGIAGRATHWMPVPAPPSTTEAENE